MRGKIHCCKCGLQFPTRGWREAGVVSCSVNGSKKHYACQPCREAGFDIVKHAASFLGPCAEPKEAP